MSEIYVNLDADQTIFFKRQLEFTKAKSYDIKYPAMYAMKAIPVSIEAGEGAEIITWDEYDSTGIMKFVADYASELTRSDVKGKQHSVTIQSLGGSYGWSLQEIRSAAYAKKNLSQMRAAAARRSNDMMQNKIGWLANGSTEWAGLYGMLYNPNITKSAALVGAWLTGPKTPDQIIGDINFCINKVKELSNDVEQPDTCLISPLEYTHIACTPRSANTDTTILEWVQKVHPTVSFESVGELKSVAINPVTGTAPAVNCMISYVRDPDHLQFEIPVLYEQLPVQEVNLAYINPVHSRVAGVNIYYPISVHVVTGI